MHGVVSSLGERPVARCDALGAVPFSVDEGVLDRPYLTSAHRAALDRASAWMAEAGMSVRLDALANLIGRYEGTTPNAKALIIGSHIDTVRNGGRYDGALGVMLGIECVDALHKAGRRLPFAVEVIAFGDEEGSRFPASMLCSRGLAAGVNEAALDLVDGDGVSLRQALRNFGIDLSPLAAAARRPEEVLAYVEPHIEQGPVLEAANLPIGIVTGIAAQLRLKARFTGIAGHAGASPMDMRRDAMAAAAACVLGVEGTGLRGVDEDVRCTVGWLRSSTQAYNVIVGEAEIGIDLRAPTRSVRDAAEKWLRLELETISKSRQVGLDIEVVQDLADCPSDPRLMRLLKEAVESTGVRPFELLSGAGHDAMSIAPLTPVAMLFIRCAGGISHNPLESVDPADVGLAAQALLAFMDGLAQESA